MTFGISESCTLQVKYIQVCHRIRVQSVNLLSKLMFPSKRLCAHTRMLHVWIVLCLLLQGSGWASGDPETHQPKGAEVHQQGAAVGGMTEEQKAFLQWYYRSEDPSSWKYAMLGLSFGALLLGSVLLVIGTMANRSRRKLAQYKASVRTVQMEELQGLTGVTQACSMPPQAQTPTQADISKDTHTSHVNQTPQVSQPNGETPKDIHTAQDSEPPHISDPPQESKPVQINVPPQDDEPPLISEPPQECEPIEISQAQQTSEPAQSPQESEPPQINELPQESESPKISEPPQESESLQISEPPQESESPQISEPPQESESPQISEPPQESELSQVSEPPQETEPLHISEPPQESEPLHISEPQESQPELESPQDSGLTADSRPTAATSQETEGQGS